MNPPQIQELFSAILGRAADKTEIARYTNCSYKEVVDDLSSSREKYKQLFSMSGEKIKTSVHYSDDDIKEFFQLKDKKIAICLSGHLRDYEKNLPSINKFIVDPLNADVFIHTWDSIGKQIFITKGVVGPTPDEKNKNLPNVSEFINNVRAIKTENNTLFLNTVQHLEDIKFYLYGMKLKNNLFGGQAEPKFIYSQFYSIYQSYLIMKEWSHANNVEYDFIIKMRADYSLNSGILQDDFDFLNENENSIFIPNTPYSNHGHPSCCLCANDLEHESHVEDICDVFAYGKPSSMEHYFKIYENLETLRVNQNTKNSQLLSGGNYILEKKNNFILCNIWNNKNYDIDCFYPERLFREYLANFHLEPSRLSGQVRR